MRTVKLTTKDVFASSGPQGKVRVSALSTDSQSTSMVSHIQLYLQIYAYWLYERGLDRLAVYRLACLGQRVSKEIWGLAPRSRHSWHQLTVTSALPSSVLVITALRPLRRLLLYIKRSGSLNIPGCEWLFRRQFLELIRQVELPASFVPRELGKFQMSRWTNIPLLREWCSGQVRRPTCHLLLSMWKSTDSFRMGSRREPTSPIALNIIPYSRVGVFWIVSYFF